MEQIKIVVVAPGKEPEIRLIPAEVNEGLKSAQAIVGGYLEEIRSGYFRPHYPRLAILCHEEAAPDWKPKEQWAPINRKIQTVEVRGTFIVMNYDKDGDSIDMPDQMWQDVSDHFKLGPETYWWLP